MDTVVGILLFIRRTTRDGRQSQPNALLCIVLPDMFGEYNTMDTEGRVVSPAANEVHFTYKGVTKPMQTILSPQQAGVYTMEYVLGEWSKELKETIKIFNQLNF